MKEIPPLGFGTWPLTGDDARRALAVAFDTGFRHIDTAQLYDNEADVGLAIRESGLKRDELFIVTKISPDNLPADRFRPSLRRSLDALGVDAVDLLLIHWPSRDRALFDPVLDSLVASGEGGLARHIGVSNFTPKMLERAARRTNGRLVTNQVEYHPLIDQTPLEETARQSGLRLTAYAALARGECLRVPEIRRIADGHGVGPAEIILSWIMSRNVHALTRSAKAEHIRASWHAREVQLSSDEVETLSALRKGNRRFVAPANLVPGWDF